jgi:rhodanese-related sulfurtransferase
VVFRWPVTALNALGNAALRLVGLQPATGHDPVHSPQELRYLLAGTQQAGRLEPAEARIASRALVLAERTAASLMTPRTEVDAVPAGIGRHELLEFHADPTTPYHLSGLGPSARTILYCASGGRSALACDTLRELGYADVAHLDGGFRAWKAAGRPVVAAGLR